MKEDLAIMDIIDMIMRRWWIVLVSMITVGVMAFVFTEVFIDPTYSSDGALYVNASKVQQGQNITQSTLSASQSLVNTYAEILKRRTFLDGVASDVGDKYSAGQLKGMIQITSANKTEIMQITVTAKSPDDAYNIAHSVLMRAPDELMRVVEAGSVKLLDDATLNHGAIAPNIRKNTLIGAILGIILGVFIIFLIEFIDTRIKSSEDIILKFDEPLLGEIPSMTEAKSRKGYKS